jgi:hypothetical protein
MRTLDPETVTKIQLRVPGYSRSDRDDLERAFRAGQLFSGINDHLERQKIWENLQTINFPILSIFSLFEDLKYLKAPAKIVRQLVPKSKFSTRVAMRQIFSRRNLEKNRDSETDLFEFGYNQINLYAWRLWAELVPECPKKEPDDDTPIPQKPSQARWHGLAALAKDYGFASHEISRLLTLDPDIEMAREFLTIVRNQKDFLYEEYSFEDRVKYISNAIKGIPEIPLKYTKPRLLIPGRGEDIERRCGRAYRRAYLDDQEHLFWDNLQDSEIGEGGGVSSFFVRSSVYKAFFGKYQGDNLTLATTSLPISATGNALENGLPALQETEQSNVTVEGVIELPHAAPLTAIEENGTQARTETRDTDQTHPGALSLTTEDAEMTDQFTVRISVWNGEKCVPESTISGDKITIIRHMEQKERMGYTLYNMEGRALTAQNCCDEIVWTGLNVIILSNGQEINQATVDAFKSVWHNMSKADKKVKRVGGQAGPKKVQSTVGKKAHIPKPDHGKQGRTEQEEEEEL